MIRTYRFFPGETVEFDDSKTVRELIQFAFDQLGYEEPAGMELVTVFQTVYAGSSFGWFTQDTSRICAEEIENPTQLCFAYHLPDAFYFAEGGWGHHMIRLGNHPNISNPVACTLRLEGFGENTVIINGKYAFCEIVEYLKKTGYLPEGSRQLMVHPFGSSHSLSVPFSDPMMALPLGEFEVCIENRLKDVYPDYDRASYMVYELQ